MATEAPSTDFVQAVAEMRDLQRAWFGGDKRSSVLEASRRAERRVDQLLADLKRGQGSLFT